MDHVNLIAALRRQLWANGFRPVAVYNADHPCNSPGKQPSGGAWQIGAQQTPPKAVTTPVAANATNTGIWCGGLQPVDIDIPDAALADEIEQLARDHLGVAPVRWRSGTGKRLMLYRASEGSPKKRAIVSRSIFGDDGKSIKVEVLGHGQHFTAYGSHPDGMDYEWRGPAPDAADLASLTPVSASDIEEFLATAAAIIGAEPEKEAMTEPKKIAPLSSSINSIGAATAPKEIARGRAIAVKALAEDIAALASTTANRNDATNGLAYRLGRMIAAGWIDRTTVESHLEHACGSNGLWKEDGPNQCRATIRSGIDSGIKAGSPPLADREAPSGIIINLPVASALPAIVETEDDDADAEDAQPIDDALTRVPGILGEVVDFIVASAARPNRRIALGAALTIVGTLIGRRMAGPTGAGTHLYVIATYPTGAGKQHALDAIDRLLTACGLSRHLGPSQFMSMSALVKHAERSPLSVCAQDEFGAVLSKIGHPKASGHEQAISQVLRSLWGANFSTVRTPAYATTDSREIKCPSLSLFGPTTASDLYEALKGRDVVNGFLNRFIVIDGGSRVAAVDPSASLRDIPPTLIAKLQSLYMLGSKAGNLSGLCKNTAPDPGPLTIPWASADAKDAYMTFVKDCEQRMDSDPDAEPFFARVAEIALRCATIRACGRSSVPVLALDDFQWGAELAWQSADRLKSDAERYMTDPLGAAEFERAVMRKISQAPHGEITLRKLHRAMQRHFRNANDLKQALDSLNRSGIVRMENRISSGPNGMTTVIRRT